jgi:hypothetical protein
VSSDTGVKSQLGGETGETWDTASDGQAHSLNTVQLESKVQRQKESLDRLKQGSKSKQSS